MTDGDLRGVVLEKFYELRHKKDVLQLPELVLIDPNEPIRISNICEQLGQNGLIDWTPSKALNGNIGGVGKITSNGVDVIEGTARAPMTITLHDHHVSVHGSSHVQIGNSNTQGVSVNIGKLTAAIDHSNASEAEKKEAKSLLAKLVGNPLVQTVLGIVLCGNETN